MPYTYRWSRVFAARAVERLLSMLFGLRGDAPVSPPTNERVGSILLVEPFQMGDLVSLSVVLDPLQAAFPHAEISILTQPKNREIFARDPRVARSITFSMPWAERSGKRTSVRAWLEFLRGLRRLRAVGGFDIGIDMRGELRSQILLLLTGCKRRIGYTNYLGSNMVLRGLLLTDDLGPLERSHRYSMNMALISRLTGKDVAVALPSFRSHEERPARLFREGRQIIVHVGGGWTYKRWRTDRWIAALREVARDRSNRIVLTGGPEDVEIIQKISTELGVGHVVRCSMSFSELVALIQGSDLFIGLDSGPMNLAVVLGIPTLALFGPGDSELWHPMGPNDVFLHEKTACNPCFQRHCSRPQRTCMDAISTEAVVAAAQSILRRLGNSPSGERLSISSSVHHPPHSLGSLDTPGALGAEH